MRYGTPEFIDLLREILGGKRHDLYETTVACAKAMSVHIYGEKPIDILNRARPREPEEIKKYRVENYEPTTKATASRALSVLAKIFNSQFYSIKWKEQSVNGKKLETFALEYYPKHNSVLKFLSQAGLKKMIADPNGIFAVKLKDVPQDDTVTPEPEIKVYGSASIWYYDNDHFLIHIKEEKERSKKWDYFQYYDKFSVIDFRAQVINAKEIAIDEIETYPHNFGEIPAWFLTGETETTDNGQEYYKSFFEPALPFWNKAINHESDLDAAIILHMHPQKVVQAEECDFIAENLQRCQNGQISNGEGGYSICPSCHGAGRKLPIGPFGVHLVKREKLEEGQAMNVPVQYVTVPVEPTELLTKRVDEQHQKGLSALNMDIIDNVGENQSGIAKVIDRGELYDFMYKISDVVFDTHLSNIFYFFNKYMFGVQDSNMKKDSNKNLPEINKPVSFDLTSLAEMTKGYAEMKEASINPEMLRQEQITIASKKHATNPDIKRKIITVIEMDPLPEISPEEVDLKLSIGTISKRDAIIHDNLAQFVERAVTEKGDAFYALDKQQKKEIIEGYADEFISENKVKLIIEDDAAGSIKPFGAKVA